MRLTDDIMRASDEATATRISNALALASAGRFGLLPSLRQFKLSLRLNADSVEVQTLDCLAVTRGGFLIDAQIDTKYTDYLNKCIAITEEKGTSELFLIISVDPKQWTETLDGYEEPIYSFDLVGVNSPIPGNALPLAHLVYQEQTNGWHVDEEDFLPPCLFVSSHSKYVELMNQFIQKLSEVEGKVFRIITPNSHDAFRIFWPVAQQILIETDKNRDTMTPMELLGNIQRFVAMFTAACHLDQYLNLSDAETFRNYAFAPYNYMNVYPMIKEGLNYCFIINEKVDKIEVKQPETPKKKTNVASPSIADDLLYQNCRTSVVTVPVINNAPGANLFFSSDGSIPSKPVTNGKIRIKNTFNSKKEEEPDQEFVIKLKAVLNDAESDVSTFTLLLHKDYKVWIQI